MQEPPWEIFFFLDCFLHILLKHQMLPVNKELGNFQASQQYFWTWN